MTDSTLEREVAFGIPGLRVGCKNSVRAPRNPRFCRQDG